MSGLFLCLAMMDIAAVSMGAQTAPPKPGCFFFFQDKSTEVELLSHMAAPFLSLWDISRLLSLEDTHFGFFSEHYHGFILVFVTYRARRFTLQDFMKQCWASRALILVSPACMSTSGAPRCLMFFFFTLTPFYF